MRSKNVLCAYWRAPPPVSQLILVVRPLLQMIMEISCVGPLIVTCQRMHLSVEKIKPKHPAGIEPLTTGLPTHKVPLSNTLLGFSSESKSF